MPPGSGCTRARVGEPELVFVPAHPTAECPVCGRQIKLTATYDRAVVSRHCRHYSHPELIEGKPFVAFRKPKEKAHAQAHTR